MKLRQEVSKIFGVSFSKGSYRSKFKEIERLGGFTQKNIIETLILLLEREEEREEN